MHPKNKSFEVATLGGGCFWCVEAVFEELKGVHSVKSGYAGGTVENPTYEQVCTGETGHAEVVQIEFDPQSIAFKDIVHVFFAVHDPTTPNRQGADVGTQYRSVIFYHDEVQKKAARAVIDELETQKLWTDPIVTELTAFETFFEAEGYHQQYFSNHPNQPYCAAVIAPKVAKFRKQFLGKLKKKAS